MTGRIGTTQQAQGPANGFHVGWFCFATQQWNQVVNNSGDFTAIQGDQASGQRLAVNIRLRLLDLVAQILQQAKRVFRCPDAFRMHGGFNR